MICFGSYVHQRMLYFYLLGTVSVCELEGIHTSFSYLLFI